ncbi:hypothetical protein EYF80_066277 [Liparis tanakae]|uniref:Uncharacterized protein n=1 Tax=Liparis tanakae TaxID=230148 RepID=A0A4Z2E5I1_9TELE|nr:hypothetical protein EYF80_066277 [Liparis tanakae]
MPGAGVDGNAPVMGIVHVTTCMSDSASWKQASDFIRPSSRLTERCAFWDSCDAVELSVLTPEVTTVSSLAAAGGARLWWAELLSAAASSSSCSAASLSEARLK